MTYNVFGMTLNLTQLNCFCVFVCNAILESLFCWYAGTSSESSGHVLQRDQGHRSKMRIHTVSGWSALRLLLLLSSANATW